MRGAACVPAPGRMEFLPGVAPEIWGRAGRLCLMTARWPVLPGGRGAPHVGGPAADGG